MTAISPDSTGSLRGPLGQEPWCPRLDHDGRPQEDRHHVPLHHVFLFVGGVMALLVRTQLAESENTFLTRHEYNQFFTMHGTTMMFLFDHPGRRGFRQLLRAADDRRQGHGVSAHQRPEPLADPAGGLFMFAASWSPAAPPPAGWTGYPPLTETTYTPGRGTDLWIIGVHLLGVCSMLGAINFLVTTMTMRAPWMTWSRMPLFVWIGRGDPVLVLFGVAGPGGRADDAVCRPPDRRPLLRPRTRWQPAALAADVLVLPHPAVYIMILPAIGHRLRDHPGVLAQADVRLQGGDLRRRGHRRAGIHVWMHHMFASGLSRR